MTNQEKFILLRKGIEIAKELQDKATEAEDLIFKALDDLGIDPAKYNTAAENASNLAEAISCYISYGEYSVDGLMKEIRKAYEGV
ncbi:hypothetical protein [Acutalibacter muris]|jgi:hypothetical protein|uniref:hypothetical protein n=1 Tax=Acutalibacter muris TaxID=1796620 RepID=UPI001C3ED618|nr:hypothetical protein [Acutalibacter muris]